MNKLGGYEGLCQLTGTVGPKIHEQHGVTVPESRRLSYCGWGDELIVFIALIGEPERVECRRRRALGFAMAKQAVCLFNAIPAVVAIHRPITTLHCRNLANAQVIE